MGGLFSSGGSRRSPPGAGASPPSRVALDPTVPLVPLDGCGARCCCCRCCCFFKNPPDSCVYNPPKNNQLKAFCEKLPVRDPSFFFFFLNLKSILNSKSQREKPDVGNLETSNLGSSSAEGAVNGRLSGARCPFTKCGNSEILSGEVNPHFRAQLWFSASGGRQF